MPLRLKRNRLRELRKAKGLSGFDLQILTSIPAQDIYRIERGLKKPLPYEKDAFAKALGISVEEIFPATLSHSQEVEDYSL